MAVFIGFLIAISCYLNTTTTLALESSLIMKHSLNIEVKDAELLQYTGFKDTNDVMQLHAERDFNHLI